MHRDIKEPAWDYLASKWQNQDLNPFSESKTHVLNY